LKAAVIHLHNPMPQLNALLWRSNIQKEVLQKYLSRIVLPAGLLLYIATIVLYHYRIKPLVFFTLADLATAMIFAGLVSSSGMGLRGVTGRLLLLSVNRVQNPCL
jgi:hypothetical protein